MTKKLLDVRTEVKLRKPTYKRVQANQFAKFKNDPKWRRPKGMGNKDRRNMKGHVGMLKVGYGSPKAIKGADKNGLFRIVVNNAKDLETIDSKTQIAIIGSTVGKKKKISILKEAQKLKLNVVGVKSFDETLKSLEKVKKATKKTASTKKVETTKAKETKKAAAEKTEDKK